MLTENRHFFHKFSQMQGRAIGLLTSVTPEVGVVRAENDSDSGPSQNTKGNTITTIYFFYTFKYRLIEKQHLYY